MQIKTTQVAIGPLRPTKIDDNSKPVSDGTPAVDGDVLYGSSFVGIFGLVTGAQVGAAIGPYYGRQIASALTTGAPNSNFFMNLAVGSRIGGIVGGVAMGAVGFAALTAATYALVKHEQSRPVPPDECA